MKSFVLEPIGMIRSCFMEKFGIPRQPGLVPEARATLEIFKPFNQKEAFRELDDFSHIWLLFIFHGLNQKQWHPTVRPPRLGGNRRIGVFATRSGFRPNPIGQSVVSLLRIDTTEGKIVLHLGGVDLLDGTPVIDIKPYVPYVDNIPQARAGYAAKPPSGKLSVSFSKTAEQACRRLDPAKYPELKALIINLLCQDPRPAYKENSVKRTYGVRLWDLNVKFSVTGQSAVVTAIELAEDGPIPPRTGGTEEPF